MTKQIESQMCRSARAERINRLWRRYVALNGFPDDPHLTEGQKRSIMRAAIAGGLSPERLVTSALEAADLRVSDRFEAAAAPPTDICPGTLAKVEVLAARAEAGCELFTAGDGRCRQLKYWEREPGS